MNTPTRFLLLTTLSAAAMLAQGPMGRGMGTPPDPATMIQRRVERLTQVLGLTDAQASQATTIFTNAQTASASLHTSMQDAHKTLQTAIKANDTGTITTVSNNIGTLQGQVLAIQSKADAAFYATLTADQKAKYDQMGPRGFGMGMGMGPGGPMGGGGMGRRGPRQ